MKQPLPFLEWFVKEQQKENSEFDKEFGKKCIDVYCNMLKGEEYPFGAHHGDCIKECESCYLCVFESYLEDYRNYAMTFYKNK